MLPPQRLAGIRIGLLERRCRRSAAPPGSASRCALKLLVVLLPALWMAAPQAAEDAASPDPTPRFLLRASLQPAPVLSQGGPYRLGGSLNRQAQPAQPLEGAGFQLIADFAPKSTCLFPIALFSNGFESTP